MNRKHLLVALFALLFPLCLQAQEAQENNTLGGWKKTRHYAACCYNFTPRVQLEAYYMYYTFNNRPAEHVLGIGLNFKI